MKKLKYAFLFFLFFIGSYKIDAYGIDNYLMDMTVLNNGDVHVKELFYLNGVFNGYERDLIFSNYEAKKFDGTLDSFKSSDIYNGSGIEVVEVGFLSGDKNFDFSKFSTAQGNADNVFTAYEGDSNRYTLREGLYSTSIKMFNPSSRETPIFYIEYLIKNVVVVHDDVAEINWNIFSDIQRESIKKMEVRVNIPGNKEETRVWGKGPLWGSTEIVDSETLLLKIERLEAGAPITIRAAFDKEVVSNSSKKSNVSALSKIVEIEQIDADEANKIREEYTRKENLRKLVGYAYEGIKLALFIVLIKKFISVIKYLKPYESTFKTKYFRDFPNDYNPTTVSYLLTKTIEKRDVSASILDLVQRKVIGYKEEKKNKFKFIKNEGDFKLTKSEEALLQLLFNEIGNGTEFTVKDINRFAKKNPNKFIAEYDGWHSKAITEAKENDFFYDRSSDEKNALGLAVLILFVALFGFTFELLISAITGAIMIVFSISVFAYIGKSKKRKMDANESYLRWNGLKSFLDDFGNFSERELPQIELWEKYLVYAVVFGNAKKLSKQMEVKFKDMPQGNRMLVNYAYFSTFNSLNNSLSKGFTSSVNNAKSIVNSQTSSGGGFGGGFSGGGGFGGGGGGGGRF